MKNLIFSVLCVSALTLPALSQAGGGTSASQQPANAKNNAATSGKQGDGERKFQINCSRCHNPPEGFSPRISGTIVRHMRVRASLSKQDEQDILRFLNP
jgi:hypothetical protein